MKKEFKGNRKQYGKGSNRRPENFRKVRDNWDDVVGFRPSKFK
jgi:hypothetical protein